MSEAPERIWAWRVVGWTGKFVDYEPQEQDKAWTVEYRRADLHSLPDEVVGLAESLLTRANHSSFIPLDDWASLAEKVLAAVERKP